MPFRPRARRNERAWDILPFADGNKENARPGLRNKMSRIHHHGSEFVFRMRERRSDCREVPSAMGCQTAIHIFKNYGSRSAACLDEAPHQLPKWPEGARTRRRVVLLSTKAAIIPSEREVLAGKGRPCEVDDCGRQICHRQARDILAPYVTDAPIGLVGPNLFRVEIVCEQAAPSVAQPCTRHSAAGEKLEECVMGHARDRFCVAQP